MKRTKLIDRLLPDYTNGEEIFNMVTHIVGGGLGVVYLVLCVVFAALKGNVWGVVSSSIYGASVIALFTMSSVYHGLKPVMAKKVMQVLDHCTIYFMIAGTYTPLMLSLLRKTNLVIAWVIFGVVWGIAALAITLTAIDLKKYSVFSMVCYIGMGWCVIVTIVPVYKALTFWGFMWLLMGGIMYTIGAVLFAIGSKVRYIHSIFHIFVVLASVMHFICIFFFAI
ncbi:MAG: hemolysin III family protein [Ruminococcaceae bacterium]|nr:hemolysin III family protein [Oscillospiraceae bacterium]